MAKIKIQCPNCHKSLSLENMPGLSDKYITCPSCRYKAKVVMFMSGASSRGGNGSSDDQTQVNWGGEDVMDRTVGTLYANNREYPLHKGRNTIGRKAVTSVAEIQIDGDDRYMSRNHAVIMVKDGMSGLEHQLEAASPKNPIKVNGQVIAPGDLIVLKWGDRLTFGHTELIFERPKYNEEATQLDI